MLYVGIDTGVNTGVAVWDTASYSFLSVETTSILKAIDVVRALAQKDKANVCVRIEDARQRRWIPNSHDYRREIGRAIGAGHVQRDAVIWEEFLETEGIGYEMIAPKRNTTKLDADAFRRVTKWAGRTNEHGRDAAMLVFGVTSKKTSYGKNQNA